MITAVFMGCFTIVLAIPAAPPAAKAGKPPASKPAKASTPARAAVQPADELLAKVQAYYDQTKDFTADFTQVYTRVALSRTSESGGKLFIKKPGMMRWQYTRPAEKLFVADGSKLYMYEPEEEQVVIDKNFKTAELGTSIRFLWGEGKLSDTFNASIAAPGAHGTPKDVPVLELVPKKDATYAKLVLVLDPKTFHVVESILFETSGNTNRFKFSNARVNTGIADAQFQFTPPPGVEIIQRN